MRETWVEEEREDGRTGVYLYRADTEPAEYGGRRWPDGSLFYGRWRPSIYMPRAASRLTLEIVHVGFERLQAIDESDARAEGVEPMDPHDTGAPGYVYRDAFARAWDEINARRGFDWRKNPWFGC